MNAEILHSATYVTHCHPTVLSRQPLTENPKYDSYDDLNVLNELTLSSENTYTQVYIGLYKA